MDEWTELQTTLDHMTASGLVEVHEEGQWLAELSGLHCEIRREGKQPLVHLWSDERNLVRRILRVAEHSPQRVVFEVRRFGTNRPARLEFIAAEGLRRKSRVTAEKFRARLARILAENFPDAHVDSLSASPDLEHSFSGLFVRGVMSEGRRAWAILAAPPGLNAHAVDGILTFGLLWLDWTRDHAERRAIEGLRLFVPEGAAKEARHRAKALNSAARVEIFELLEDEERLRAVDLADTGNLESWLTSRREIERTLDAAHEIIERIRAMDARAAEHIAADVRPGVQEVAVRFRGLEFARWAGGRMAIGIGDDKQEWSARTPGNLKELLGNLEFHRSPVANPANHAFYRAAPERWLETIVRRDPTQLDAQLDSDFFYSQVPALSDSDRGVIDLLGVTRKRRVVVIELKASEDIHLPLQAVEYWLRVRQHLANGDFQRYGYFTGIELDPSPPLLWLVGPGLRFHPASDTLLRYLSPEIQVTRIGVNENWRRGLRVVFRQ
jgi:DNA-binding transcriptional ArsR family regulator